MDIGGMVGMDGLVGSSSECGGGGGGGGGGGLLFSSPLVSSESETSRNKGLLGSAFLKQVRPGGAEEQDWRCPKMARTEAMLMRPPEKTHPSLLRSNSSSIFPDGQQMLSFSSPKQDALVLCNDGSLPYYHPSASSLSSSASYGRSAVSGLGTGSLNMNMHGALAGVRGGFTPSQWMELEHQAMIYKCIDANVPIPPSLLMSIRKSLNPSGYNGYSTGSFRPSAYGWGSFQLGFSGSSDPEPGRCRRTDGKKWRCSRDAVPDQKYCERHLNRGRHRSRKPVEGQNGHAKAMPIIAPLPAASTVSGNVSSNSIAIAQDEMKSLQPGSADPSPTQFNRIPINKENMKTSMNPALKDKHFTISKQHNPFEEPSQRADFGFISSDSPLNPSRSSNLDSRTFASSLELTDQESQSHPLRHFIDNWPKNQSNNSTITWPEVERTQLSISIPMGASEFSSSSPSQEKLTLSPLKQSQDLDPIHMGLGVGGVLSDACQKQASWQPISWGASMGGPLGEVLNNTHNTTKENIKNNSSSLNLMTYGWESNPQHDLSPTGVLQKITFGSLSSSTGSSPRAENYMSHESTGSLCDDLLRSTLVNPASISTL